MGRRRDLYRRVRGRARRLRAGRGEPAPRVGREEAVAGRGRPPEATLERTNLGPVMDDAVLRARQRMRIGVDPDYDLVHEHFDALHYLLQTPRLLDDPEVDLVEHYLENGVARRLNPHPDFSTVEYLARHPKKAGRKGERSPYVVWLKQGRADGDIADPAPRVRRMAQTLGIDPHEVVDLVTERRRDLQERLRTGELGRMFARAAEIEPLIGEAWPEISRPRLLPLSTRVVVDAFSAIHRAQEAAGFRRARVVFVINRGRWGGGRRMEGHMTHALAAHVDPDEIVVIYTDESTKPPDGRYPDGVRQVDFAQISRDLSREDAQHALVMLLRSFRADAIVNINSRMLYHALRTYGRALAVTERLFLVFFCNEQTAMGTWRGWSLRYMYRAFDEVAGVLTDSEYLAGRLVATHRMGRTEQDRLHVLRAPVDPTLPLAAAPVGTPQRRRQVFWAGRWDRQKRVDLFLEIARRMPDVDFRMWGETVLGSGTRQLPDNVLPQGRYAHFTDLPLDEADAWLYTSGWDGVPSLLLEVAMTGIPIVGTLVGGTEEILAEGLAWPVDEEAGPEPYVRELRSVLAEPEEARRRAGALRERLLVERTEKGFADQVVDLLLQPAGKTGDPR